MAVKGIFYGLSTFTLPNNVRSMERYSFMFGLNLSLFIEDKTHTCMRIHTQNRYIQTKQKQIKKPTEVKEMIQGSPRC